MIAALVIYWVVAGCALILACPNKLSADQAFIFMLIGGLIVPVCLFARAIRE